jgi:hypothetical protein
MIEAMPRKKRARKAAERAADPLAAYRRIRTPMPPPEQVMRDRRRALDEQDARREMDEPRTRRDVDEERIDEQPAGGGPDG